jgi:hypothetical protein
LLLRPFENESKNTFFPVIYIPPLQIIQRYISVPVREVNTVSRIREEQEANATTIAGGKVNAMPQVCELFSVVS